MTARADTDAFVRFAKAHLPSKAERTIYPVLAGAPDRDWTAGEVAATAGVSHHEADQALRRFASAGIVDHSHVRGQSHRYRWHPDMGYLRQGDVSGPAIDPVCGMPVPPRDAAHRPRRRHGDQVLLSPVLGPMEVGPASGTALISRQIPSRRTSTIRSPAAATLSSVRRLISGPNSRRVSGDNRSKNQPKRRLRGRTCSSSTTRPS